VWQLQVPEEVTIMMADDNWGNLMGVLPWGSEHKGGGGIYYHADCTLQPLHPAQCSNSALVRNAD
jgi:hypothetical protein